MEALKKVSGFYLVVILISALLVLAACSETDDNTGASASGDNEQTQNANNEGNNENNTSTNGDNGDDVTEEATITMAYWGDESSFNEWYKDPLESALPHITLEMIDTRFEMEDLEQLIAAQQVPDIFYFSGASNMRQFRETELAYDLRGMIETHNFDLSRIESSLVEAALAQGDGNDELYLFPLNRRTHNVYYNRGIFDMFGVSYPEDMMTLNEIIDLAAEVTGEEDGIAYHGFDVNSPNTLFGQLGLTTIDGQTDEPTFDSDLRWQTFLGALETLWSIPGILPDDVNDVTDYLWSYGEHFREEQNVAMVMAWDQARSLAGDPGLDWDMVTWPTFDEAPTTGPQATAEFILMTSTTENEDAAFEVLDYFLSDEYQTFRSAYDGRSTVLTNPDVQESFMTEHEHADVIADKNIASAFMLDPVDPTPVEERSDFSSFSWGSGNETSAEIYNALAWGESDVNTLLAEAQQITETMIEEQKAQEGIE